MAVFEFRGVVAATGKVTKGVRDAENAKALRTVLRRDGILLTAATEEAAAKAKKKGDLDLFRFMRRIGTADIAVMTRQLATLGARRHPARRRHRSAGRSSREGRAEARAHRGAGKAQRGDHFAKALEQHPRAFPPIFVNMVAARQASGHARASARASRRFHGGAGAPARQSDGALAYPLLMALIGNAAHQRAHGGRGPQGDDYLRKPGSRAPLGTRRSSSPCRTSLPATGGSFSCARVRHLVVPPLEEDARGRMKWNPFCLKCPFSGRLLQMLSVARFSKTLATLLAAGVPLLKAMDIVRNVLAMRCWRRWWKRRPARSARARAIADPLRRSGQFPAHRHAQ